MGEVTILAYEGYVDHAKIDDLLKRLKSVKEFLTLDKIVAKRVYSISVECLENLSRYSVRELPDHRDIKPFISIVAGDKKIYVRSGNPVDARTTEFLEQKLNKVNGLTKDALDAMFERNINRESIPEDNGTGLGFIIMKLKSGNKIGFGFTGITNGFNFFNIQVSINKHIMRKLIIEKTAFSPEVILDPERNLFVISGESRPPDVANFYGEILRWFDDFSHDTMKTGESLEPVTVNLDFEYFNSSSAKCLLDFCKQIAHARAEGMDINVKWHFEENDFDMLEAGREMSKIARFPFEFITSGTRF